MTFYLKKNKKKVKENVNINSIIKLITLTLVASQYNLIYLSWELSPISYHVKMFLRRLNSKNFLLFNRLSIEANMNHYGVKSQKGYHFSPSYSIITLNTHKIQAEPESTLTNRSYGMNQTYSSFVIPPVFFGFACTFIRFRSN